MHIIKIVPKFTQSFYDKYVTLILMANKLSVEDIKKLKAVKAIKVTTQEVVTK